MLRLSILLLAATLFAQQPADEAYTKKIREFTTDPMFLTELVDHLPASATVPTPEKVLGYIAGAADKLTYAKDVYRYMREVEKASPRGSASLAVISLYLSSLARFASSETSTTIISRPSSVVPIV